MGNVRYDVDPRDYYAKDFDPFEWISEEDSKCTRCKRVFDSYTYKSSRLDIFKTHKSMVMGCWCEKDPVYRNFYCICYTIKFTWYPRELCLT